MEIIIVGTGNTATILGRTIKSRGHSIRQVYGRNPHRATMLAAELESEPVFELKELKKTADICVLAVSDSAIQPVVAQMQPGDQLVVHTAGSVSKDILKPLSGRYGVLYPLQSLRSETSYLPEIPLLIDAADKETLAEIQSFAETISSRVMFADDFKRLRLHLAAVVVNNFVNHLYALTEAYCKKEDVSFDALLPLIKETASRLEQFEASEMQTGPALRNDQATIESHLRLLSSDSRLQEIYKFFTDSIKRQPGVSGPKRNKG